jgi:hypothetical protein
MVSIATDAAVVITIAFLSHNPFSSLDSASNFPMHLATRSAEIPDTEIERAERGDEEIALRHRSPHALAVEDIAEKRYAEKRRLQLVHLIPQLSPSVPRSVFSIRRVWWPRVAQRGDSSLSLLGDRAVSASVTHRLGYDVY